LTQAVTREIGPLPAVFETAQYTASWSKAIVTQRLTNQLENNHGNKKPSFSLIWRLAVV